MLTDSVNITRPIRERCPPSISIYALIIKVLAFRVSDNKNIQRIKIPNPNTQLFQHADDCSNTATNINDYNFLISEFTDMGKISG